MMHFSLGHIRLSWEIESTSLLTFSSRAKKEKKNLKLNYVPLASHNIIEVHGKDQGKRELRVFNFALTPWNMWNRSRKARPWLACRFEKQGYTCLPTNA